MDGTGAAEASVLTVAGDNQRRFCANEEYGGGRANYPEGGNWLQQFAKVGNSQATSEKQSSSKRISLWSKVGAF